MRWKTCDARSFMAGRASWSSWVVPRGSGPGEKLARRGDGVMPRDRARAPGEPSGEPDDAVFPLSRGREGARPSRTGGQTHASRTRSRASGGAARRGRGNTAARFPEEVPPAARPCRPGIPPLPSPGGTPRPASARDPGQPPPGDSPSPRLPGSGSDRPPGAHAPEPVTGKRFPSGLWFLSTRSLTVRFLSASGGGRAPGRGRAGTRGSGSR